MKLYLNKYEAYNKPGRCLIVKDDGGFYLIGGIVLCDKGRFCWAYYSGSDRTWLCISDEPEPNSDWSKYAGSSTLIPIIG